MALRRKQRTSYGGVEEDRASVLGEKGGGQAKAQGLHLQLCLRPHMQGLDGEREGLSLHTWSLRPHWEEGWERSNWKGDSLQMRNTGVLGATAKGQESDKLGSGSPICRGTFCEEALYTVSTQNSCVPKPKFVH